MGIETIAMGALIGSSVLGAGASLTQGRQQGQLADAQADQLSMQAAGERDSALATAQRIRRAGRAQQAEAKAAYAAAGVDVNRGTAVRVGDQIDLDSETDAYMAILQGERRGRTLDYEAKATRHAGRNARRAGVAGAFRSILGGAASYGLWSAGGAGSGITQSSMYAPGGNAIGSFDGLTPISGGQIR